MMNNRTRLIGGALLWLMTTVASAADDASQVLERLKQNYPNTRFTSIQASPLPGLYEVVMGENIAYTDAAGRYFIFQGHLFDMETQVDLTAARQPPVAPRTTTKKSEFPAAFLGNAIKTVKGDGKRQLAVFTDPDCPYCKRLEDELARLDNVTIYRFMYPLDSLHPEAKAKTVAVWCSPQREDAWNKLIATGKPPRLIACNNPINDNLVLGSRLGVVGTPTLIAGDGRLLPGAAPAARIDAWLGEAP